MDTFFSSFFWHIICFTYTQALLSALLSGLVGTVGAVLWSENRFFGRSFLWHASLLPFALPPLLAVLAFVGFWGKHGLVSRGLLWVGLPVPGLLAEGLYGWPAILIVHTVFNFPIYLRLVGGALAVARRDAEMVAITLGASRARAFRVLTLPKLWPALRSAFLLSFLFSAASFVVVMMLGGGPRFTTLEVQIYQAVKVELDPALAMRCALVQLAVALAIYAFLLRAPLVASSEPAVRTVPLYRFRRQAMLRLAAALYFVLLFALAGGPLLSLILSGWREGAAVEGLGQSALTSVILALGCALLSTALALGLAYLERHLRAATARAAVALVAGLPLAVSSLVLTLGMFHFLPQLLRLDWGRPLALVLVQSLLALPLVYRPLRDALHRLPDPLLHSARSLGASPLRAFASIELPLIRRSVASALAFGAAFSLGEIGAVLVLLPGESALGAEPLPLLIYRLMGQYRFAEAYRASLALLGMLLLITLVAERGEQ